MRVMVIIKADKDTEAGVMPGEDVLAAMGNFNEELVKAGIMLAGEGLHPSSRGKRILLGASGPKVIDGPFAETKELIAGFWLWKVNSMEEAVEWAKRMPAPMGEGRACEIEVREVYELEDFGSSTAVERLRKLDIGTRKST